MHADLARVRPRSGRAVQLQSTSLESWEHTAPPAPYRPDPAWAYSIRLAVAAELEHTTVDGVMWENRVKAMRNCGLAGLVLICRGCDAPYLVPFRCGARTCPSCAWRTANAICERLMRRIALHDLIMENEPWGGLGRKQRRSWRHLVLTTRAAEAEVRFDPEGLRRDVRHVRSAVSRFWRTTRWGAQRRDSEGRRRSRTDTSYIVGQEVSPSGMVHMHMLVFGEYVGQAELQQLWSDTIGDVGIVHVSGVKAAAVGNALRYVLKYVTKGEGDPRESAQHAAAVELALRNVHRLSYGGAVRAIRPDEQDGTDDDGRPEDLHDRAELTCEDCGLAGEWFYGSVIRAEWVEQNNGFGPFRRSLSPDRADIDQETTDAPR